MLYRYNRADKGKHSGARDAGSDYSAAIIHGKLGRCQKPPHEPSSYKVLGQASSWRI